MTIQKPVYKIITTLVAATFVVAISVGISLYNSAVRNHEANLLIIAQSVASLISAVAEFDDEFPANDNPDGSRAATLLQIRNALSGPVKVGATGEIILITKDGENIRFLVHQTTNTAEPEHPAFISPGSDYYTVLRQALDGREGIWRTHNAAGHEVALAFVPGRPIRGDDDANAGICSWATTRG